jgi:hypothetical protein
MSSMFIIALRTPNRLTSISVTAAKGLMKKPTKLKRALRVFIEIILSHKYNGVYRKESAYAAK